MNRRRSAGSLAGLTPHSGAQKASGPDPARAPTPKRKTDNAVLKDDSATLCKLWHHSHPHNQYATSILSGLELPLSTWPPYYETFWEARTVLADWWTISAICESCLTSGFVLRHIIPMVRDGRGFFNRATATGANRVSTETAISGINVTPIPAPTI